VDPQRCDVAVVGAGLVGLALAYELAELGARVVVVDAAHRGRATDAGAGILSPATSVVAEPELWPFLVQCGAHYPRLLERVATDGADVSAAGYAPCGVLSLCLRPHEDEWFAPFAERALRRAPADVSEITPAEARTLFPPLGRVHRALFAPGSARVDGRGLAAALRHAAASRGVAFVRRAATGVDMSATKTRIGRWQPRVPAAASQGAFTQTLLPLTIDRRPFGAENQTAIGGAIPCDVQPPL